MTQREAGDVREYYRLITEVDIGDVARELLADRIIPKLRGVETVYICQDNELSEAGLKGALRTAGRLSKAGIETRIVTLPLGPAQEAAREQLRGIFGLEASPGPGKLKELLKGRSAEDIAEAERLLGEAKIDVGHHHVFFCFHTMTYFL